MTGSEDVLRDSGGRPVLAFVRDTRAGRPCADLARPLLDDLATVARVVAARLAGWAVVVDDEQLGRLLRERGASVHRHAHGYSWDSALGPPRVPDPPAGLVVEPLTTRPEDLLDLSVAAYPPGHPDNAWSVTPDPLGDYLRPLLAGQGLGPLLGCSGQVRDGSRVVAMIAVTGRDGEPPHGGPWVSDVCRYPAARYRGLGELLLRRAMALAVAAGLPALSLAVTEGNDGARRLYERLGFRHAGTRVTLLLPAPSGGDSTESSANDLQNAGGAAGG